MLVFLTSDRLFTCASRMLTGPSSIIQMRHLWYSSVPRKVATWSAIEPESTRIKSAAAIYTPFYMLPLSWWAFESFSMPTKIHPYVRTCKWLL